ncbi:MAG: glycoside hydrolase family 3 protein [Pseudomonadota bacterium]
MKTLTLRAAVAACAAMLCVEPATSEDAASWPAIKSPYGRDAEIELKISDLIARMSVEQKVGQIIQAEIKSISPADIRKYHIGSVLNGGGSLPADNRDDPLALWVAAANAFYDASMDTSKGGLAIPVIWGTDAVHGHNNVRGATIFPHNIGLGAANDPALMRNIGVATAHEVAATGIDWAFAPTVAVARDPRWGRTYESYSDDPEIVATLSSELILGLQGHPALGDALNEQKVVATAKHFIGDGGTTGGVDQGDTAVAENILRDVHGRPYFQALGVGVQTVMASFNSWNGEKLHGHKYLLTDVLKDGMGFDGLVVGDWNGHGQVEGCSDVSCPQAINAGVDLIMVPEKWKAFHRNTVRQAKRGEISTERLDDAVRRVLRVKFRAGLFDNGRPSQHALAARFDLIGHPDHRAIARTAVQKSLVLLKNDEVLPIDGVKTVFVGGAGADNIPMQAGGWSVTWQGDDTDNGDFPGATSILEGFKAAIGANGGEVSTDPDANADVAVIVFGENPYAEFEGDLKDLKFPLDQSNDFKLMQRFKQQGVSVVAVFLTGRPRSVDAAINVSDAFVVAWLPGTEGAGVADVLVAGGTSNDFSGRLPFDWPRSGDQRNLYKRGYGLRLTDQN